MERGLCCEYEAGVIVTNIIPLSILSVSLYHHLLNFSLLKLAKELKKRNLQKDSDDARLEMVRTYSNNIHMCSVFNFLTLLSFMLIGGQES